MKTSLAGRAAIKNHEGVRLSAYPDPATKADPFTIGVGHTSAAGPPKVIKGMRITAAQADEILARDLATFEKVVNDAVTVALNQNEFDALVSLAFNIGGGNLAKSTLVKRLNAGDRAGAADQFKAWNKAAGKVMKGLTTRRAAERKLFLTPIEATPTAEMSMKVGDTGPLVEELQRNLITLDYPLNVTSTFDKATDDAVRAFQRLNKDEAGQPLKVDGIVGLRTSKAIAAALLKPKIKEAEKNVPATATKAVEENTGFLKKFGGWLTGGSLTTAALAERAFGADWKTVLAIGGLALIGAGIFGAGWLVNRWLKGEFKQINAEAKAT